MIKVILPAILLAFVSFSHASFITLVPDIVWNGAEHGNHSFAFEITGASDDELELIEKIPQNGTTQASTTFASTSSRYRMTPSGLSASWEAKVGTLDGSFSGGANSEVQTFIRFRPETDLRYTLEASYSGVLDESRVTFFTEFFYHTGDINNPAHVFFDDIYQLGGLQGTSAPFEHSFSDSGVLPAGKTIFFRHFAAISNGQDTRFNSGSGQGSFTLRLNPTNVPDTGSALLMLGLALGGIGFLRHRI